MGLAWTSAGGATLIIEAVAVPSSSGGLKLTGNMGDVMKESANIAYSFIRTIANEFKISTEFFEKHLIHLHIPEGATPKDGPSAGAAMASAILSLSTGRQVRDSLAMTGELSLTGRVMAIGGLKEKVIAAKRNGIKMVIFPKANEKDLEKIPEHVKKGITFIPVSSFKEVIKELFKNG
jgi:ATP-dependent Lon protease